MFEKRLREKLMSLPDLTSTEYKLRQLANFFAVRYKSISKCVEEGHIKEDVQTTYVCKRCGIMVHPKRKHIQGMQSKMRKLRIKIGDLLREEFNFDGLSKYKLSESEINLVLHKLRSGDFKIVGR